MNRRDAAIARCGEVRKASSWGLRTCRLGLGLLFAGASVFASTCAQEPPREIAMGDDIGVGPYAFKVVSARTAPNPPPPISSFRRQPGKKGVVVYVSWKTIGEMDGLGRLAFIEDFLQTQLSIVDSEGKQTAGGSAMQERLMFMDDPGSNWRDGVVVFHVPDESRGLALLVKNPEPREAQTRLSTTPLGM